MDESKYNTILGLLRSQLIPACGCTEPIALAYASAIGQDLLKDYPVRIEAWISSSIIKNVKSVVVPSTGGMKGIEVALASGIIVGHPERELQILSDVPPDMPEKIKSFLAQCDFVIKKAESGVIFDIDLRMVSEKHSCRIRIAGNHTNIVLQEKDGNILFKKEFSEKDEDYSSSSVSIRDAYDFATTCEINDVSEIIDRQVSCNTELSENGLQGKWGASVGRNLLSISDGLDPIFAAMAKAAAGSDARMSGCEYPAVINSGSGNQGLTVSIPVIEFAKKLNSSHEELIRSLVLSNLVAISIKGAIGCLSAYCGAVSAGCGAAAGIALLYGLSYKQIERTVSNGLAVLSGMICDGAKPSCAAKVAMAIGSAYLGLQLVLKGDGFLPGDGIVKTDIDSTISAIGRLSRDGLFHTNEVILDIMLNKGGTDE